jgi:hypothetical protein
MSFVDELRWWHPLVILGGTALIPLFRAAAVVLVARCVKKDLAKLAIPLILRSSRPSPFSPRDSNAKPPPDSAL